MCAPGVCPDSPTGTFIPIHTEKLVIVDSSQQSNISDVAWASISITLILFVGLLTAFGLIFAV